MKKVIIITVIVAAIGGVGFLAYRKYAKPKVKVISVDWLTGSADVDVNGKSFQIPGGQSLVVGNGYSVSVEQSFYGGTQKMDWRTLVLKKNGVRIDVIAERQ